MMVSNIAGRYSILANPNNETRNGTGWTLFRNDCRLSGPDQRLDLDWQ